LLGEYREAIALLRKALTVLKSGMDEHDTSRMCVQATMLATSLIDSGLATAEARALLDTAIRTPTAASDELVDVARLPLAKWHLAHDSLEFAEHLLGKVGSVGDRVEPAIHAEAGAPAPEWPRLGRPGRGAAPAAASLRHHLRRSRC
jgi:hypothetical protein